MPDPYILQWTGKDGREHTLTPKGHLWSWTTKYQEPDKEKLTELEIAIVPGGVFVAVEDLNNSAEHKTLSGLDIYASL